MNTVWLLVVKDEESTLVSFESLKGTWPLKYYLKLPFLLRKFVHNVRQNEQTFVYIPSFLSWILFPDPFAPCQIYQVQNIPWSHLSCINIRLDQFLKMINKLRFERLYEIWKNGHGSSFQHMILVFSLLARVRKLNCNWKWQTKSSFEDCHQQFSNSILQDLKDR